MTRIKRPAAAAGAAVLLAFSLSACGGAPTDASKDDFCETVNDTSVFENTDTEDVGDLVDALKKQAENLEEVGTPDDISDDEREGFEIYVDAVNDLDADDFDSPEDLDNVEDDYSDEENDKVNAFFDYQAKTCTPDIDDLDIPSDELTQ